MSVIQGFFKPDDVEQEMKKCAYIQKDNSFVQQY